MRAGIVGAVRTPIGNFGGSLKTVPAYRLAALVLNESIRRANVKPEEVNMVVLGQNYQSGEYVNMARFGLLLAQWPVEVPGYTLDRRCPSGADAIWTGAMMIESGNADIVVTGGVESMSTVEFYLKGEIRWSMGGVGDQPKGHGSLSTWSTPLYDRILRARIMSQPVSRFGYIPTMITWAEEAAKEYNLSRTQADEWALRSHMRASAAVKNGTFDPEVIPVPVPQNEGDPIMFTLDERPRANTSLEKLGKLKPIIGGVCTAGNSSGENDGACALTLMSEKRIAETGMKPLGYLKAYAITGTEPKYTYKSLSSAIEKGLNKANLKLSDIDLIEIHEAFAPQVLANFIDLKLTEADYERINVNGSCISLGHPLGATGARISTTLLYEMNRRNARYGLMGICGGGGMGVCLVYEKA